MTVMVVGNSKHALFGHILLMFIFVAFNIDTVGAFHRPIPYFFTVSTTHRRIENDVTVRPHMRYDNDEEELERDIGDYVKGVHGGKYQFEDFAQLNGGLSYTGNEFAQSLYTSSTSECETRNIGKIDSKEELPRWAQRLRDADINEFGSSCDGEIQIGVSVQIKNEERTWETFYAFVLSSSLSPDEKSPLTVYPETGSLAPRGGAANVCDENKPYLDSASLTVVETGRNEINEFRNDCMWLIIGTEEATWKYRIVFQ